MLLLPCCKVRGRGQGQRSRVKVKGKGLVSGVQRCFVIMASALASAAKSNNPKFGARRVITSQGVCLCVCNQSADADDRLLIL